MMLLRSAPMALRIPGALGDGDQHDVHNADAADGQGDGGNAAQEALLHLVLLLALLLPGIGGGDIALIRAQQAVQVALEQGDGLGGRGGVLGLCHKAIDFGIAADDAVHGIGNEHIAVHTGHVVGVLLLKDADNGEGDAVDGDLLTHGVNVVEEGVGDFGAEDTDLAVVFHVQEG